jgi:phosphoribosylglycinamide formyltransferase-1
MRILSEVFIAEYYGKIINIHPSLLPKYKGMNTHERVLENNEEFHGVTVHYVDDSLDGGPICAQSKLKINTSNVNELENQIHELEYKLYPEVIKQIAEGKMNLIDGKVSKG